MSKFTTEDQIGAKNYNLLDAVGYRYANGDTLA
jgi:hypothetical protein